MILQSQSWAYTQRKLSQKDTCSPNVHCSTIYNGQDMEKTYLSIDRCMDKEDVVCIHNGILFSHKMNEIIPFAARDCS